MRRPPTGFTLVETMVSVALVAVLLALIVPSLSSARRQALGVVTLTRLGSSANVLTLYTIDHRDAFPYFVDPALPTQSVNAAALPEPEEFPRVFYGIFFWHVAIADQYFDGNPSQEGVCDARYARGSYALGSAFWYPCTFFARPAFWDQRTRTGRDQIGRNFSYEVIFPSRKVVLTAPLGFFNVRGEPAERRPTVPCGLVDGSAVAPLASVFVPGVPTGEGDIPDALHRLDWLVGLHTVGGVRGLDLP